MSKLKQYERETGEQDIIPTHASAPPKKKAKKDEPHQAPRTLFAQMPIEEQYQSLPGL